MSSPLLFACSECVQGAVGMFQTFPGLLVLLPEQSIAGGCLLHFPATWLHRFNSVKWGHSHLQLPFNFVSGFLPLALSYVEFQQSRTSLCSPSFMATPPTSPERACDATRQSEHDQHTLGSPPQRRYPQAVAQPPPDLPQALLSHPPLPIAQYPVQRFRRMHPIPPPQPPQFHHPPPFAPYPMHPHPPLAHGFPPPAPLAVQPGMEEMHRQYFGYPPPAQPYQPP
ncbi:hypothetical protein BKA83DRAFT_4126610 [Pisolithus microcarpus]|nr:hypothetical protein BKA83DRAFT_4126610 [Pisolithus microcarpus]